MTRIVLPIALCRIVLALAFLQTAAQANSEPGAKPAGSSIQVPPGQAEQIGKGEEFQRQTSSSNAHQKRLRERASGLADVRSSEPGSTETSQADVAETLAIDRIGAVIRDALSLRKTLVVWLVEQSAEAAPLSQSMADQICRTLEDLSAGASLPQMAVFRYSSDVKLLTAEPTSDVATLRKELTDLDRRGKVRSEKTLPFTAVNKAVDKYLPYRKLGFEVIFVIAGASSGDDLKQADDAIAALKRSAVPVFGLGPAVPFNDEVPGRSHRSIASSESIPPKPCSETLYPERVPLESAGLDDTRDLTDSGYGPFGLERLCHQTGGRFFRLRAGGSGGWDLDPATGDVKPEMLANYAPDYVNEDQYKQLLSENKCRRALHNAAQLPTTLELDPNVRVSFPKEKDEATMAKGITVAQRAAAERDQPLQHLYDAMVAGESDRPNLTGARWQAEYDLAMGQVLAAKARLDGYNTILAVLKQGKTFANPTSKRWVLEPADELAVSSALDKMVKSSRAYLQRVVTEHKGTPWAAMAQAELNHPAGWKLVENSEVDPNAPIRPKRRANR